MGRYRYLIKHLYTNSKTFIKPKNNKLKKESKLKEPELKDPELKKDWAVKLPPPDREVHRGVANADITKSGIDIDQYNENIDINDTDYSNKFWLMNKKRI